VKKPITEIQADIIFKALYYTARNEGVELPSELTEVYEVLAEHNPNDTFVEHTVEVMDFLSDFLRNSSYYKEFFIEENE
jgi:transcriptional regulator